MHVSHALFIEFSDFVNKTTSHYLTVLPLLVISLNLLQVSNVNY